MEQTLVDLLRRNIERDLQDAPAVHLQDDCDLQDLGWMPEVVEPTDWRRASEWTLTRPKPRA